MRDSWRLGHLVREAVRNTLGRAARLLPAVALAVVLGAGSAAFLAVETHGLRAELDALAQQGRGVVNYGQASADAPALVSRASCERLAHSPGVDAAGALARGGELTVVPVGRAVTTQRASTTLFPQLAQTDVLVGTGLAERPTALPAHVLVDGVVLDSLTAAPQREGLDSGHALTAPLRPDDTFVERCVVVLDPMVSIDDVASTHIASLHVEGNAVVATEVLRATNDPLQVFLDRPSRFLPVLLGVLGAVATAITYRLRASELAVYRLSGSSGRSLLVLIALETLLVTGIAAVSATAAAIVLRDHVLAPVSPILWGLVLAGTWGVLTLVATADLALRKPTDLAKDR